MVKVKRLSNAFGRLSVADLFIPILFVRFFTEFIDRKLGFGLSHIVTAAFLVLSVYGVAKVRSFPPSIFYLSFSLALFFLSALFSTYLADLVSQGGAIAQNLKYFIYVFLPFIGYALGRNMRSAKMFYFCIYFALMPSLFYAIFDGVTGGASASFGAGVEGRAFGFGSHPVLFGIQIVLMLSILLVAENSPVLSLGKKTTLWFYCIFVFALYVTFAKTAWIFFLLLMVAKYFKFSKSGLIAGLLVVVASGSAISFLSEYFSGLSTLYDFVMSGAFSANNNYEYVDSSMHWRIIQWSNLFGVGMDNFSFGVGPGQSVFHNSYQLSAHSSTLEVFVEQGVFGFICYMAILFGLIIFSFKYVQNNIVLKFVVLFYILMSTFSVSMFNQTLNMILFLLFLGFCASPAIRVRRS